MEAGTGVMKWLDSFTSRSLAASLVLRAPEKAISVRQPVPSVREEGVSDSREKGKQENDPTPALLPPPRKNEAGTAPWKPPARGLPGIRGLWQEAEALTQLGDSM